jgi:glycosyltransferase involved in cell wall biosynthesis
MTILLANELSLKGYRITLIGLYKGNGTFYPLNNGIEIEYLSDLRFKPFKYIADVFCLKKLLKRLQPNIVISINNMFFRTLPASIGAKHKLFSWHHRINPHDCSKFSFKILNILITHFSDNFILLSEANADFIKKEYGNNNAVFIPNPLTMQGKIAPSSLQNKITLYLGRLCKEKGTDLLLQAWRIVYEKHSDWRLQLVGRAEENFALEKINGIIVNDATPNVKDFYESASIFVIPSRAESLPLIAIEAKAFGLPIVSTNWGMNAKDMIQNNVDGFIVDDFDTAKIAERINDLIENEPLRRQIGKASLESSKKYALNAVMDKWDRLLKDSMGDLC